MPISPRDYAKQKGTYCPNCGSGNCYPDDDPVMGKNENEMFQEMHCVKCQSTWRDRWELVGYDNLKCPGGSL